ncbi:hypothetical protein L798_14608 [Zootermopsis nevadensis]|uniref:DUF4817 domain-containing protein n=1 Tax=Zootermopsis nevadensis TaxID=136037 RepID=A0A067QZ19_ZOONE|nr:hypothetical protein L798_14608 [Zootermopsis nevadensis]
MCVLVVIQGYSKRLSGFCEFLWGNALNIRLLSLHWWIEKLSKFCSVPPAIQYLRVWPPSVSFCNMAADGKKKAFCTLEYQQSRSVTIVQRHFHTKFEKDQVFVLLLPATILDLKVRIRAAILNITADTLGRV